MAERIAKQYRHLFEIRLLHHYWLDEGSTVFDMIADQTKQMNRLLRYDVRPFLALEPTAGTQRAFEGLGCVYKNTALGCIVALPGDAAVMPDTVFEFIVTVKNPMVFNYTALTLRPQKIHEAYYQPAQRIYRIYRYKGNVPVLSNLTGTSRVMGSQKTLFLSREIPALGADDQVESIILSGNMVLQLTGDQPNADKQQLYPPANNLNLPVFVHQGDVPVIAPPAGVAGAPPRGIRLSDDIPDNVFTLIRLAAVRPDDADFSFIDGSGRAKSSPPVFQIRFKNRSSVWQYRNNRTGALNSAESKPLPLTNFGNAGTKQKPSQGLVKVVKNGTRITQIISEIFI